MIKHFIFMGILFFGMALFAELNSPPNFSIFLLKIVKNGESAPKNSIVSIFSDGKEIARQAIKIPGFAGLFTLYGLRNNSKLEFYIDGEVQSIATNVANTLIMIAMAPMLSAILGAIFLKEVPDKKTWIAIAITLVAVIYIFYDSLEMGNLFGDLMGITTAFGLATNAVIIRSAKDRDLLPSAVVGKLTVALFALFFVESYELVEKDLIYIPLMCILCVAIPFVLVTIAPRFIPAEEVNLFFLLETILGPIWVWLVIKEQPSLETIVGGLVIIFTIAVHSYLKLKSSSK
jgi:drug/metabolite transporter (DMT)-like permease